MGIILTSAVFPRYVSWSHSMIFQKTDPRVRYFDLVIDVARDAGLVEHYFAKWTAPKNMRPNVDVREVALVAEHFFLPCFVGGCTMTLAMIVFLVELHMKSRIQSVHS